jgi:predicted O-linked N-acetylglucosamine transferase (SPINDLY family)
MINQQTMRLDIAHHLDLIQRLHKSGRAQEAISAVENASQLFPEEYLFKLLKNLFLPIVYTAHEEISLYRQRFEQGLQELIQQTSLKTLEEKTKALEGITRVTNFYLAYQDYNDLELQRQYGNLVHQIAATNYPNWVKPRSMPPLGEDQKIRVGYISGYIHNHSGTYWLLGWMRYCDREKFEIYSYYIGDKPDAITQRFKEYSDVFHHIPGNIEAVCQQILTDNLHILVFPELGIDALTFTISGLRLAPVQCTDWGYPVTSGIPTIDYYISSELMEPENAQEHYTETLICLPNLGIAYPKINVPPLTKTRADFGLRDDAVVYLCCQAPYKYLPQHDFIFAEIARRVPQAQFVFVRADVLQQRLQEAFAAVGKNSQDYCVFIPFLDHEDYLRLNSISHVFLDTFGFTGGNTTLAALACNLPVLTCPGEFMRGRMSYGMLEMLGLSETIAQDEAEYIEIAARLGLDAEWRQQIVEHIAKHKDCLFDDKGSVAALEEFYQRVVRERLMHS